MARFDANGRDAGGIKYDPIPEIAAQPIATGGLSLLRNAVTATVAQGEKSLLFESSKLAAGHFEKWCRRGGRTWN